MLIKVNTLKLTRAAHKLESFDLLVRYKAMKVVSDCVFSYPRLKLIAVRVLLLSETVGLVAFDLVCTICLPICFD